MRKGLIEKCRKKLKEAGYSTDTENGWLPHPDELMVYGEWKYVTVKVENAYPLIIYRDKESRWLANAVAKTLGEPVYFYAYKKWPTMLKRMRVK